MRRLNDIREVPAAKVVARDFLIFYIKLLVDGAKGVVLLQLALLAVVVDLIFMIVAGSRRSFFYMVLEVAERFDLWLNLYRPSRHAGENRDGLFGESVAGSGSFLGEVEELVHGRERVTVPRNG